jgi:TolA-binding protein
VYQSLNQATPTTQKAYARLLYGKSIQLINEQKLNEAVDYLNKILKISVATNVIPYANFWLGELAYRLRRYDDAVKFITQFINSNMPAQGEANLYNANYTLGYAWFQKEQFKNALTYFEPIANTTKANATTIEQDAAVRIADCYFMLKDYSKAASLYQTVIDKKYAQADYALYQNAMITGVKNNTEKIKSLTSLMKLYPSSTLALDAQLEIAQTYIADEKFMDAVPFLNNIINSKEDESLKPRAYLKLGVSHYNNNDNKNALVAYRQLIKSYPQSEETSEAMATIRDIFIEDGKPEGYVALMKENGIIIAVNEADSLSYITPYNKYEAGDCMVAIPGF